MQVNSVSRTSYSPPTPSDASKMRQAFQKLGTAIQSGNQADTKDAWAQLQKNAPSQAAKANNPLTAKMETLGKAIESGDMTAAQKAYSDIKETASQQRPAAKSGGTQRAGGPPPGGGHGGGGKASGAGEASSSNKTYDKLDLNQDGTVSEAERLQYALAHPDDTQKAQTAQRKAAAGTTIDIFA